MAWPTADVSTTYLDSSADSAASARADLYDLAQKFNLVRQFFGATETVMAAAATVDIGGQTGNRIAITSGSGAITSLGVNYGGPIFVRVAVDCSLTYNATTLVTPGGVNLTLRAGDWFLAIPKASGGAANGWLIVPAPWSGQIATNGATPDTAGLGMTLGRADTSAEGGQLNLCRASDNAVAWIWDVYGTGASPNLRLIKNGGGVMLEVDGNGNVGFGAGTPTAQVDIGGNKLRIRTAKTPASASDTGNQGDVCWDASYLYVCTATNTWKRTAIATW